MSKKTKIQLNTKKNYLVLLIILVIIFIILLYISRVEKFTSSTIKQSRHKIALCFLINNSINHEELWYNYLKIVDPNKYNIYIHYKENKPLKYFEKYKLPNTIETCWGCLSIVLAQNLLLKKALDDTDNHHFVWLSESCIPIKSFQYLQNYLDTDKSYFNIAPDNQVFPRANPVLEYISKDNIKKAAMPAIINRKHAELFVNNETNIQLWFTNVPDVDEIVYITLLHHFGLQNELVLTPNLSANAIIFTGWPDMSNYKLFVDSKLTKTSPNEYDDICNAELDYLIHSKSLFARKFNKNCKGLTGLLEKIN